MGFLLRYIDCCGSNGNGQLGLNHSEDIDRPTFSLAVNQEVEDIAIGGNHSLILFKNKNLFASGEQCGFFDPALDSDRFDIVQKDVTHVCAGWDFTAIVKNNVSVFLYDKNGKRHLIDLSENAKFMRSSLHSVIIVDNKGSAFAFGDNKKGQLFGDVITDKNVPEPTKITFEDLPNSSFNGLMVLDCCMGRDYTIFHLYDEEKDANIILMRCKTDRFSILTNMYSTIGDRGHEIQGSVGVNKSRWFFVDKHVKINGLKSMWSSVHVWYNKDDTGNKLVSFGNNVYGQKYDGSKLEEEIDSFDVGTEHGLLVTKDKHKVYAWGWGEHGNCGPSSDGSLKLLFQDDGKRVVQNVFGGYANTFIVTSRMPISK